MSSSTRNSLRASLLSAPLSDRKSTDADLDARDASLHVDFSVGGAAAVSEERAVPLHPSVYLLCLTGFLMSFKPSEPFITVWLVNNKHFSQSTVSDDIYPQWTYSYLVCLVAVGIMSHLIGSRFVVLLGFAARIATRLLLLFGRSLGAMMAMQAAFGLASASEPVFYALIYISLRRSDFKRFTGYMQGSVLAGHLLAGVIGQALVSSGQPLHTLFIISAVSVGLATILFIFIRLPTPHQAAAAAHRQRMESPPALRSPHGRFSESASVDLELSVAGRPSVVADEISSSDLVSDPSFSIAEPGESWMEILHRRGVRALIADLASEYARPCVLWWSVWWWLGQGVVELVLNYNTSLFYQRAPTLDYNGAVIACGRGAAAITSLLPAWTRYSDIAVLTGLDMLGSIFLLLSALLTSVYLAYVLFVVFYATMQFVYAMSMTVVAANVSNASRRTLVFTSNTFLSLVVQTLTQTIIGHNGLHLEGNSKFLVLAGQLFILTGVFLSVWMLRQAKKKGACTFGYRPADEIDEEAAPTPRCKRCDNGDFCDVCDLAIIREEATLHGPPLSEDSLDEPVHAHRLR